MIFSFKRFWSVFMARTKEFYRDKGTVGWTLIFPFLIIVGFAYMFRMGGDGLYKGGYFGADEPPKIDLMSWVQFESKDEALSKLSRHQIDLAVDFSSKPYAYWLSETSPKSQVAEKIFVQAVAEDDGPKITQTTGATRNTIVGREIKYVEWLFPGLLAMNVTWMALFGVGWVIVRYRKLGVLKRFKASPLTAFEFLSAQMFSRLMVIGATGTLVFAASHLIYPFKTEGSYFDLFVLYLLGSLCLSSIGLVVASRMSSDELASGILNFVNMPMIFLSEVWFSLEGSSEWVKWIAQTLPLWHMAEGMRKIMTEGASLGDLSWSLVYLVVLSFLCTLLGSLLFKWTKD